MYGDQTKWDAWRRDCEENFISSFTRTYTESEVNEVEDELGSCMVSGESPELVESFSSLQSETRDPNFEKLKHQLITGKIISVCMHCGIKYGVKDGMGVTDISHGICGECYDKIKLKKQ